LHMAPTLRFRGSHIPPVRHVLSEKMVVVQYTKLPAKPPVDRYSKAEAEIGRTNDVNAVGSFVIFKSNSKQM